MNGDVIAVVLTRIVSLPANAVGKRLKNKLWRSVLTIGSVPAAESTGTTLQPVPADRVSATYPDEEITLTGVEIK